MNYDIKYAYFIFVKNGYKISRNKFDNKIGYGSNTIFMYETNKLILNYSGI